MPELNRWNHVPDVAPQGDEFLASSSAFPGVYGEGETCEEAIESFWGMVDFIGDLARQPDWPHDRSPYVDTWESLDGDEEEWSDGLKDREDGGLKEWGDKGVEDWDDAADEDPTR